MVVALGVPLFPLGNVHIHEECVFCGEGTSHGLDDWKHEREDTLVPALDDFAAKVDDPAICSQALRAPSGVSAIDLVAGLGAGVASGWEERL